MSSQERNIARVETAAQAAEVIRAELPKEQREERVFVLPMDANGRMLAKPILVSVGHEDGTAAIEAGAIFREYLGTVSECFHICKLQTANCKLFMPCAL